MVTCVTDRVNSRLSDRGSTPSAGRDLQMFGVALGRRCTARCGLWLDSLREERTAFFFSIDISGSYISDLEGLELSTVQCSAVLLSIRNRVMYFAPHHISEMTVKRLEEFTAVFRWQLRR